MLGSKTGDGEKDRVGNMILYEFALGKTVDGKINRLGHLKIFGVSNYP